MMPRAPSSYPTAVGLSCAMDCDSDNDNDTSSVASRPSSPSTSTYPTALDLGCAIDSDSENDTPSVTAHPSSPPTVSGPAKRSVLGKALTEAPPRVRQVRFGGIMVFAGAAVTRRAGHWRCCNCQEYVRSTPDDTPDDMRCKHCQTHARCENCPMHRFLPMEERGRRVSSAFAGINAFAGGVTAHANHWRCCNCAQYVCNTPYDTRCEHCKIHARCRGCDVVAY